LPANVALEIVPGVAFSLCKVNVNASPRDVVERREVIDARGLEPEQLLDPLSSAPAAVASAHLYLLRDSTWAASSRSFLATSAASSPGRRSIRPVVLLAELSIYCAVTRLIPSAKKEAAARAAFLNH
jgi:hypothetical protein